MVNIGDQLLQPEAGWKRIEVDSIANVAKNINFVKHDRTYGTNGTIWWGTSSSGDSFKFKVYGKSIRMISGAFSDCGSADFFIDGKLDRTISLTGGDVALNGHNPPCRVMYQKIYDTPREFEIKIVSKGGGYVYLDCFDIDTDGFIVTPPTEVGDPSPEPEQGWRRYDNTDSLVEYLGPGWHSYSNGGYWGGTAMGVVTATFDNKINFSFVGTKIRIIDELANSRAVAEINIDGNIETFTSSIAHGIISGLSYEKTGLENKRHRVSISHNSGNGSMGLDAIDIDSDGELVITLPEISKDYEFPVKTIEKADVEAYAATCINEEEQLLVAIEDGSQYLTRGDGTYIECGISKDLNIRTLEKINETADGKITFNNEQLITESDLKPSHNSQYVKLNVLNGVPYLIPLKNVNSVDDFIIQAYGFIPGQNNIAKVVKEFDSSELSTFTVDRDVQASTDITVISSRNFPYKSERGFYVTDEIKLNEFEVI